MKHSLLLLAAISLFCGELFSQDDEQGEYRFRISFELWKPSVQWGKLEADKFGITGTELDPENDLGTDRRTLSKGLNAEFRLSPKNAFLFSLYGYEINGETILSKPISFAGVNTFTAGMDVKTKIDNAHSVMAYEYDPFVVSDYYVRLSIGVIGGLGFTSHSARVLQVNVNIPAVGKETESWEYPVAGIRARGKFYDWFFFDAYAVAMPTSKFEGAKLQIFDSTVEAGINVSYGIYVLAGYRRLSINIDDKIRSNFEIMLDTELSGPFVSLEIHF